MRGRMTIKPGRWTDRMKHRHAHAQRGGMNRDDVNMNEAEEGDDIIGTEPARSDERGSEYMNMT